MKVLNLTSLELKKLALLWLVWRCGLLVVAALATRWLAYQPSFPYFDTLLPGYGLSQLWYSWANFDGVHYLTIVDKGYVGTGLIQAFFPVYPLLVGAVKLVIGNTLVAGLVVSQVMSLVAMGLWYGFIKQIRSAEVAWWSTLVLWSFPTSFFLGSLYSEGTFLAVVIGGLWLAHRRHWWQSAVLVAVASATRVVGVGLVAALAVEWWASPGRRGRDLVWVAAGSAGLVAFMTYLWAEFHDPLYFFHVQSQFGAGRQTNLVSYPQVIWRYIKILLTYQPHDWKYLAYVQEAVTGVLSAVGLLAVWRRAPLSWWIFAAGAILVPSLTGNFSSFPRYILVCLPFWLVIGEVLVTHRWLRPWYLLGSVSLLILNVSLFVQGYWVA